MLQTPTVGSTVKSPARARATPRHPRVPSWAPACSGPSPPPIACMATATTRRWPTACRSTISTTSSTSAMAACSGLLIPMADPTTTSSRPTRKPMPSMAWPSTSAPRAMRRASTQPSASSARWKRKCTTTPRAATARCWPATSAKPTARAWTVASSPPRR